MNARILGPARADLLDAADYYARDSQSASDRFLIAFEQLLERLILFPQSGWSPHSAPKDREIRETLVPEFPYRVVYEVLEFEIVILSIIHGSSRKRPWRKRLS